MRGIGATGWALLGGPRRAWSVGVGDGGLDAMVDRENGGRGGCGECGGPPGSAEQEERGGRDGRGRVAGSRCFGPLRVNAGRHSLPRRGPSLLRAGTGVATWTANAPRPGCGMDADADEQDLSCW